MGVKWALFWLISEASCFANLFALFYFKLDFNKNEKRNFFRKSACSEKCYRGRGKGAGNGPGVQRNGWIIWVLVPLYLELDSHSSWVLCRVQTNSLWSCLACPVTYGPEVTTLNPITSRALRTSQVGRENSAFFTRSSWASGWSRSGH